MMRRTVLENGVWCFEEDHEVIGRQVGTMNDGRVVLENEEGDQAIATYGTIGEEGVFTAFCQITDSMCGAHCASAGKGSCRYNRNIQEGVGYYVNR